MFCNQVHQSVEITYNAILYQKIKTHYVLSSILKMHFALDLHIQLFLCSSDDYIYVSVKHSKMISLILSQCPGWFSSEQTCTTTRVETTTVSVI